MDNKVNSAIIEIKDIIFRNDYSKVKRFDVKYGTLGHLLFLQQFDIYTGKPDSREFVLEHLENIAERIGKLDISGRIYEQLCDFGWFLNYLATTDEYKDVVNFDLEMLDDFIFHEIEKSYSNQNIDIIDGLLCGGYYFINQKPSKKNSLILSRIIDYLYDIAIKDSDGLYWVCTSMFKDEKRVYLGLTHGSVSVLVFAYQCAKRGINTSLARKLITLGYSFLIKSQFCNKSLAYFPILARSSTPICKLEWCYGDIPIAYSLPFVEEIVFQENKNIRTDLSNRIMEKHIGNQNLHGETRDHSVVHGNSGLAILYRLYSQNFRDRKCYDYSRQVTERVIRDLDFNKQYLGISPAFTVIDNEYLNRMGLISGLSGIGLNFLSYENPLINSYKYFLYLL